MGLLAHVDTLLQPPDQPAFQTETERLISRLKLAQVQRGAVVPVKYNPDSRDVALFD